MNNIVHKTSAYGVLVCVMAGVFYAYEFLLRILPGALQIELMDAFGHIPAGAFGQLASLYYFAYSPMQLPVGLMMDRYGPRRILIFSCLMCAVGSWMFAHTDSMVVAGAGRLLVGLGSSFAFVGMLCLAHHWLPRRFFSLLAGLATTFAMLTLMFGVVKMTSIVAVVGLNTILFSLVWFGLILAGLMYLILKDAPGGVQVVHTQPLSLFFKEVWQVLRSPQIWLIGWMGAAMYTALSVFGELWGKTYLQQAHHLSALDAAQAISGVFLGWAVGAPIVGYLSDHTGYRMFPLFWGALLGLVSITIVIYVPGLSWWIIATLLFLYGVFTSSEIIIFIMGKETSDERLAGTVFASVNMIVMLGGAILQPLVGYILDWCAKDAWSPGFAYVYTIHDYQLALSVLPLSLGLVLVLLGYFRFKYG